MSGRDLALARRKAMSSSGKSADTSSAPSRTRTGMERKAKANVDRSAVRAAAGRTAAASAPLSSPVSTPRAPARRRAVNVADNSSRSVSLARRKAMSSRGKSAASSKDRTRSINEVKVHAAVATPKAEEKQGGCGCGCNGAGKKKDSVIGNQGSDTRRAKKQSGRRNGKAKMSSLNPGRAASLARRQAQSSRGKAGVSSAGMTPAQTARAGNPGLSGRELAKALREQQSRRGGAGKKKSAPCGRVRPSRSQGSAQGASQDAPWKVGISETASGQSVTGTMVGRSPDVTGDEPSTCRSVTGTEYMGADIFRDFCQAEAPQQPAKVRVSPTGGGNTVTGNEVGRSTKMTGDESGTCKRVTGTEYVGADQSEAFCGVKAERAPAKISVVQTAKGKPVSGNNVGRSAKVTGDEPGSQRTLTGSQYMVVSDDLSEMRTAPPKVGTSATLRNGSVSGTMVGRSERVTGDEPGSCRSITGDDYVGKEQFSGFCAATPEPTDSKVGISLTLNNKAVTGTMTGRAGRVTGDEPGTCKAVTGTPYAGSEQYQAHCAADQAASAAARMRREHRTAGAPMTGQQPAIGGQMTGDAKGACEAVSGTPYVGADQVASACPATAAEPNSPDFPQPIGDTPWGEFSVQAPAQAAQQSRNRAAAGGVTGEPSSNSHITGPFGMASGKVSGTEEARFGSRSVMPASAPVAAPGGTNEGAADETPRSRVTGEGMAAAGKITGDDWDRGDHVTGTEGASSMGRNPTRRGGPMNAMAPLRVNSRNTEVPEPVSRVTGSSGNTENGSLITYSGGARG